MSGPLECGDLPSVQVNLDATFEPVRESVLALRDRVEDLCNQELGKITKQGPSAEAFPVWSHAGLFLSCCDLFICSLSVNDTKLFTLGSCKY